MMSFFRLLTASLPLLFIPAVAEQQQSPPPEVEQALRARVKEFYQACVDHKFRDAEKLLAEESKDDFYNSEKPEYLAFQIQKIDWSDNFTKATVFVEVTVDMHISNVVVKGHPVAEGDWRIIDGQWYMHLITKKERFRTPFGTIVQLGEPSPKPVDDAAAKAFTPAAIKERTKQILAGVTADPASITLDSVKPAEQTVKLTNGTPGIVELRLTQPELPGLSASIDRTRLAVAEQATMKITWSPKDAIAKPSATIHVVVAPTGQDIPLQVAFSYDPSQAQPQTQPAPPAKKKKRKKH